GAGAAQRSCRSAGEAHQSGKDEGAAFLISGPSRRRQRSKGMKRLLPLVALTAVFAGSAHAETLTKLRVAYDGFSMTSAPLNYAVQQGIFKKFGLDVTPVFVEGGPLLTQAVVGGSVDIAQNGYTPAAGAAVQGADIVFIGGISNKLPFQLVVTSSINTADQLKGQSIAISRFGSSTDT